MVRHATLVCQHTAQGCVRDRVIYPSTADHGMSLERIIRRFSGRYAALEDTTLVASYTHQPPISADVREIRANQTPATNNGHIRITLSGEVLFQTQRAENCEHPLRSLLRTPLRPIPEYSGCVITGKPLVCLA